MQDAMTLFESIVNSMWFKSKPIILFLNKMDLFREKLHLSPINEHFADYKGSATDFKSAAKYFAECFRRINRTPGREIFIYYTNATDTHLLKATMESVRLMIFQKKLYTVIR